MLSTKQKDFIEKIGALARRDMENTKVLASLTIAQAILESGWGESGLTKKANALFGIKASSSWSGKIYNANTKECYDGVNFTTIKAGFRAYDSLEESIADHSRLLTSLSRYKKVIGETDYKKACKEIRRAGYATDPSYANKLIGIIEAYDLTRFDLCGEIKKSKGGKMKSSELIKKLKDIEANYKTRYAWGCFGCPLTSAIVNSKAKQYPNYYGPQKRNELITAGRAGAFGFDCVNVIKGILWGWNGDNSKTWGGANYASNGVPDISANTMINKCIGVSSNFSNIIPGEAVWLPGHIGVYIGGGVVIECTPKWSGGVQKSALLNIGSIAGMNGRKWQKHGKIPYLEYDSMVDTKPQKFVNSGAKSVTKIAREVLKGKWGNDSARKRNLTAAGYDYNAVQREVNRLVRNPRTTKSVKTLAREVLQGKWGNGSERKRKLEQAGYNYSEVQNEVNKMARR